MQVQQLPIYQFLEGSGKSFVIPVYQRDYAWTKINCQKLWNDLVELKHNKREDHFLGTLVTIGSGFQEYTVIDGQQRLTTASILLLALHNFLKHKENKSEEENILVEQTLDFLINKYSPEKDKRIRLKPNKQDKEYFENLFVKDTVSNIGSNIVSNYIFFYERIKSEILSPQEVFDSFRKLKIVLIDLVRGQDDPQLIFESLNSTGVDLTAGDLIRNYILMDLEALEQERMYKEYWITIEKLTGDTAEFIRNYLNFKTKVSVKRDDVYNIFKVFAVEVFQRDKESILKDLLDFAEIYSYLVQISQYPNKDINRQLARLNRLEFTISHSYLLDVLNDLKHGILTESLVKEILIVIESYAFRKILVDSSTQGLNKMFITLSKEIKKEESWQDDYLNILNFILLEKRVSQRFPTNEEFENALITKEVYKLQAKNRNFLLESLENYNSSYPIFVDELTVEHIMPQTLTESWKKDLGDNWQEIHRKYVHTLGNLTLTAKNSELSNGQFKTKQEIDYQNSRLKLNYKLDGKHIWDESAIIDRSMDLIKDAKDIWPFPTTTYIKPIPEEQIFDLTSEDSFTGSKPSRLYIADDEIGIKVTHWFQVVKYVCKFLYEYSPTQFNEIRRREEFSWNFNMNKPLRVPIDIAENVQVEGNLSANGVVSFLSKLCERLNYPAEHISFSIKYSKKR